MRRQPDQCASIGSGRTAWTRSAQCPCNSSWQGRLRPERVAVCLGPLRGLRRDLQGEEKGDVAFGPGPGHRET